STLILFTGCALTACGSLFGPDEKVLLRYGHTEVGYPSSRVVDVRPYDIDTLDEVCTDELSLLDHTAEVTVDSPGAWVIRFHGRWVPPDTVVVIERSVYASAPLVSQSSAVIPSPAEP